MKVNWQSYQPHSQVSLDLSSLFNRPTSWLSVYILHYFFNLVIFVIMSTDFDDTLVNGHNGYHLTNLICNGHGEKRKFTR